MSSSKAYKAVVFDMDGVLVASEQAWEKLFRNFLSSYGKELSDEDAEILYGCSDAVENEVISRNIGVSVAEARALKIAYTEENPIPYGELLLEGVVTTLERLKSASVPLALATSSLLVDAENMLNQSQFHHYFDEVVTGDQVEEAKPNPAVYLEAARRLGIAPEDCLAVDDSNYGVRAAACADMSVVHFGKHAVEKPHELASFAVANHTELLALLTELLGLKS